MDAWYCRWVEIAAPACVGLTMTYFFGGCEEVLTVINASERFLSGYERGSGVKRFGLSAIDKGAMWA